MQRMYQAALRQGLLRADPRQALAVEQLSGLQQRLARYEPLLTAFRHERNALEQRAAAEAEQRPSGASPGASGTAAMGAAAAASPAAEALAALAPPRKPRGLYLHGHVGTGKTVLMDMFFESAEVERKRRVHLHEFMLEVHQRIHRWKHAERDKLAAAAERLEAQELQARAAAEAAAEAAAIAPVAAGASAPGGQADPLNSFAASAAAVAARHAASGAPRRIRVAESDGITEVAKMLAQENTLLAFDEFVVTDVVDALILKHLFGVMFREGSVMVATSNTAPADLYKDGLNYPYFAPFIPLLEAHCKVFDMDSSNDYRLDSTEDAGSSTGRFLYPLDCPEQRAEFERLYRERCRGAPEEERELAVAFGRRLRVRRCSQDRVCRFTFDELCDDREPVMAAADFQALCGAFDTIMVEDVPALGLDNHNETRRFITLVDQMYDRGVALVALAAAPPLALFDAGAAPAADDLLSLREMRLAARRMASRLVEMTR